MSSTLRRAFLVGSLFYSTKVQCRAINSYSEEALSSVTPPITDGKRTVNNNAMHVRYRLEDKASGISKKYASKSYHRILIPPLEVDGGAEALVTPVPQKSKKGDLKKGLPNPLATKSTSKGSKLPPQPEPELPDPLESKYEQSPLAEPNGISVSSKVSHNKVQASVSVSAHKSGIPVIVAVAVFVLVAAYAWYALYLKQRMRRKGWCISKMEPSAPPLAQAQVADQRLPRSSDLPVAVIVEEDISNDWSEGRAPRVK